MSQQFTHCTLLLANNLAKLTDAPKECMSSTDDSGLRLQRQIRYQNIDIINKLFCRDNDFRASMFAKKT